MNQGETKTRTEAQHRATVQIGWYKCRPCRKGVPGFVAWATLVPMTDAGPCEEPAEPLWFEFGSSYEEAVAAPKRSVEREAGVQEWVRQEASK